MVSAAIIRRRRFVSGEPTPDTTAPMVSSAVLASDGVTLTVTFNEALDTGNDTAAGEWAVSASSTATSVSTAAIDTGSTTDVILTLGTAVTDGETVTVDYSGTSLRNAVGNQVATFTGQTVTNNSGQYEAPVSSGTLSDQLIQRNTGVQTFDTSGDFSVTNDPTLSSVSWAITTNPDVTNITIDSDAVISFDTNTTGLIDTVSVVVEATNNGGSATSGFSLTVADVPDAFATGDWSVGGSGDVEITGLPADNFDDLTDIEYRVNGGTAQSFGATTTGTYATGANTGDDVELRAVNSLGAGAWSDVKVVTVTPVTQADVIALFGTGDKGFFYDFSDKPSLKTDLAGTTAVTASGDPIGYVEDLSGNGNDRAAPFTSARPTYTESGAEAYAYMASGGSNRLELQSAITGMANNNELTLVMVYSTYTSNKDPITMGDTGTGDYARIESDRSSSSYRAGATTGELTVNNTTAADTTGNNFVVTVMKRGTEGLHYINGTLVETDTGLSATWDSDLSPTGPNSSIRGDANKIHMIFAIDRGLSDTELGTVHNYGKSLGGIT